MTDIKHNSNILLNKILKSDNFPSLIIYGTDMNKYNYLIDLINNKYDIKDYHLKKDYDIEYLSNKNIFIFNLKKEKFNNLFKLFDYICENTSLYDYKYIIINNFNKINILIQNKIKVYIEKNIYIKFILITDIYNSIINQIHSRSLSIKFMKNSNIIYDNNYISHYDIILKKLINISKTSINQTNFKWIKDLSYNLLKYNIDYYKNLLDLILENDKYTLKLKFKIIKLFSESQNNLSKSYYNIIHIESFIIHLIYLLSLENQS
jgi:hypothetical protein